MRAPISVVIPTLNAEAGLPDCLMSLGEGLQAGLIRELIVSDGGSEDDTHKIAEAAGAVLIEGSPSRGCQLKRGAQVAQGAWFLFLHADTTLAPGWSDVVLDHLEQDKAGYFKLHFIGGGVPGRIVAGWANLRSRLLGMPFGDQGLLIPCDLYDSVGGYRNIPLMEDVALARALKGKLVSLNAVATTSPERYHRDGWMKRSVKNARLQARYFFGDDPGELLRTYRK